MKLDKVLRLKNLLLAGLTPIALLAPPLATHAELVFNPEYSGASKPSVNLLSLSHNNSALPNRHRTEATPSPDAASSAIVAQSLPAPPSATAIALFIVPIGLMPIRNVTFSAVSPPASSHPNPSHASNSHSNSGNRSSRHSNHASRRPQVNVTNNTNQGVTQTDGLVTFKVTLNPNTIPFDSLFNAALNHNLSAVSKFLDAIVFYYDDDARPVQRIHLHGLQPQSQKYDESSKTLTKVYTLRYTSARVQ